MTRHAARAAPAGPAGVLGWAAYLGASWTWCIGMVLPALLLRDYGTPGFIVFALPNILGAAAFAWYTSARDAVSRMADEAAPQAWFSSATIAFHAFTLSWLAPHLAGVPGPAGGGLALLGGALFAVAAARARGPMTAVSLAVLASSLALCVWGVSRAAPPPELPPATMPGLEWLAPVAVLGFLLCPRLDGTFHRARASCAGTPGRLAFALGFGLFFAAMIACTAAYAPVLTGASAARTVRFAIAAHLLLQSVFTVGLHMRELAVRSFKPGAPRPIVSIALWLACLWAGSAAAAHPGSGPLVSGEIGYRLFLGLYGLVFPAYVWLVAIPRGAGVPARRALPVWALAVSFAAPFFWMGFIDRQTGWLVAGLACVLLPRLLMARPSPAHRLAGA